MDIVTVINTVVVPLGLMAIMVGLGLSLGIDDFRRVLNFPKAAAIGLGGQLLLLPAIAFLLTTILPAAPAVAVGLIILSACPGGISSNAFVFALRGDVALSVTLTAITSVVTVFTIPLITALALAIHMSGGETPGLPVLEMIGRLSLFTVVPVAAGMIVRAFAPRFAAASAKFFRPASLAVLVIIIGSSVVVSFDLMKANLAQAAPIALLLNLSTMAIGFVLAKWFRLSASRVLTITFEIGLQNVAVAVLVTLTLLGDAALSVVPIIYGVIMLVSAFSLAGLFRRAYKL